MDNCTFALDECFDQLEELLSKMDRAKKLLQEVCLMKNDYLKGHKSTDEVVQLVSEVDELLL